MYDKNPALSFNKLDEVVTKSDFIFISVPTPSNKDGSINLEIVKKVISEIDLVDTENKPIILLRSTIVPGTSEEIQNQFQIIRLFLTRIFN